MSLIKLFFKENYFSNFAFQDKPSQMYLLEELIPMLNTPLPLKKAQHNLLIVLKSGEVTIQINTKLHNFKGACLIFISAGTIYSLKDIEITAVGYFTLLENKVLTAIMNNETILNLSMVHPMTLMDKSDSDWYCKVCSLFYEEVTREQPSRIIAHSFLQAILIKMLEMAGLKRILPREEQVAVQFKLLVNEFLSAQHTISFYADKLSISTNYLNRCLKSVFNKSAREIIIDTLILHSQLMLLESNKDVAQVAYELRFEDPSYFSRIFKKVSGMSPTAFREKNMHT